MWYYTADTATRIAQQRFAGDTHQTRRSAVRGHRTAAVLRSLADRIDAPVQATRAPSAHWS